MNEIVRFCYAWKDLICLNIKKIIHKYKNIKNKYLLTRKIKINL